MFCEPEPRWGWLCLLAMFAGGLTAAEPVWVDDSTRALDPAHQARLARELRVFHQETGVQLGIKTVPYIDPGVTLRAAVRAARRSFASEGPVAVILVDRGKNGLGISHSPELWQRYPLAEMVEVLRAALSQASVRTEARLEEKLLAAAGQWMAEVRRLEEQRRNAARLLQAPDKPVLLGSLLVLGGGVLGVLFLSARRRLRQTADLRRHEFPDSIVGQRLGAPYGGGHIAEWQSGPPAASRQGR